MTRKTLWIAQTGIFLTLVLVLQAVTTVLGSTLLTGSVVNLLLVLSVMLLGLSSGVTIAALSPVFAKLLGIGPLWSLIPFIIVGNLSLVLVWHFVGKHTAKGENMRRWIAWIAAAVAKFFTLYIGIVRFAVPVLLELPEKQAAAISAMFSVAQLITALAGGLLALLLLPPLRKIRDKIQV